MKSSFLPKHERKIARISAVQTERAEILTIELVRNQDFGLCVVLEFILVLLDWRKVYILIVEYQKHFLTGMPSLTFFVFLHCCFHLRLLLHLYLAHHKSLKFGVDALFGYFQGVLICNFLKLLRLEWSLDLWQDFFLKLHKGAF